MAEEEMTRHWPKKKPKKKSSKIDKIFLQHPISLLFSPDPQCILACQVVVKEYPRWRLFSTSFVSSRKELLSTDQLLLYPFRTHPHKKIVFSQNVSSTSINTININSYQLLASPQSILPSILRHSSTNNPSSTDVPLGRKAINTTTKSSLW